MRHKHVRRLIKIKPLHRLVNGTKKIVLPGFEGLSLYLVSRFFFTGLRNGTVNMRASSLSFSFFLALFPTVIFVFTLIPYIPIKGFQDALFNFIQTMMPKAAFDATKDTIVDIVRKHHGKVLSVGFASTLYFSTNGFNAMINSFNATYHVIETRNWFMQRLVSLFMAIVTVVILAAAIAIFIYSERGIHLLNHNHRKIAHYLIPIGKWVVLSILSFCLISFNYYAGPKRKHGWKFFSAGSTLATIFIIVASLLFAYYVNTFGKYNKLYGSIGTLVVVMMWIYINSFILLLGFDLNASIYSAKKHKVKFTGVIPE
jgi:membrane protein